jgi:glycerate kinase
MRTLAARYLCDGDQAVVEMAAASGLSSVADGERDAMAATSFGTGQILAAAIERGCRHIVIGVGGSATTDGGAGLLEALGARFRDPAGNDLGPGGGALRDLADVDLSGLPEILSEVSLVVASDVSNPLLGAQGAAATYGPQKGASPTQVDELDRALRRFADVMEGAIGRPLRYEAGTGAAGGMTFGLMAIADRFAAFEVRPGVDVCMELTGFDGALVDTDLVLTGEGHVDHQTAYGKTAMGVSKRAAQSGVPSICFGGGVTQEGYDSMADVGVVVIPVIEAPMTVEEIRAAGTEPISRAAERMARIFQLARRLG